MTEDRRRGWTVFTKPWPDLALGDLAAKVRQLGFDGVELPIRPGFQVEPDGAGKGLARAVQAFANEGLRVASVATEPTPSLIDACGIAGVPIIRICVSVGRDDDYLACEAVTRRRLDDLVKPLGEAGVKVGVQNHYGDSVSNAMGVRHLIEAYDPAVVGAVWDGAHCGLDGESPRLAADILWSHLCLVNLKNARWERAGSDRFDAARWHAVFVPGREGLCSWPEVLDQLHRRGYEGDVCLTAEYSDVPKTDEYVAGDLSWARTVAAGLDESVGVGGRS